LPQLRSAAERAPVRSPGCDPYPAAPAPRAQVIGWTSNYQETLKELGLEDADVGFPEGPDRGSTVLIAKYIARIRTTLHAWFENILEVGLPTAVPPSYFSAVQGAELQWIKTQGAELLKYAGVPCMCVISVRQLWRCLEHAGVAGMSVECAPRALGQSLRLQACLLAARRT
jgi:hypothetical protein